MVFDPSLEPGYIAPKELGRRKDGRINLWNGWKIRPRPGDWSLIRDDYILDVICSGDEESYEYVLNWLANMFKHPNVPGQTALVLRGAKGSGKSTLGDFVRKIVGEHSFKISRRGELTGDFSGHLKNKIFLQAEEAMWAGDKKGGGGPQGPYHSPGDIGKSPLQRR